MKVRTLGCVLRLAASTVGVLLGLLAAPCAADTLLAKPYTRCDVPFDYANVQDGSLYAGVSVPSSFDLRNVDGVSYVTSVKNQGSYNACWTFGLMGTVESDLLRAGGAYSDFSENNLKNWSGFDGTWGGTEVMAIAYFARLSGPVSEADDPYQPTSIRGTPPDAPRQGFVSNADFYTNAHDMKAAVMAKGGLTTTFYWTTPDYRASDYTYYNTDTSYPPNHCVVIVGWDDSRVTAGGTGAWLIKNSWGPSWGDSGFFWMSYQDALGGRYGVSFDTQPASAVANVHTYAPDGDVVELTCPDSCSVFHTTGPERLKTVGFYTQTGGAGYVIRVYRGWTAGGPSGLLETITGSEDFAGFHTADLPAELDFADGSDFVIGVYLSNGGLYPQAVDYDCPGYDSDKDANPGESYYSFDGANWTDLTTWNSTADFSVYAYTTHVPEPMTLSLLALGSLVMLGRRIAKFPRLGD